MSTHPRLNLKKFAIWGLSGMIRHMYKTHLIDFNEFSCNWESLTAYLTQDELQRAARFVREADARSYIIAHAQLRRLLAQHLGCDVGAVVIATNPQGKPFIVHPEQEVHFNMSHSGQYALIGISDHSAIGVDIERLSDKRDFHAIAQRFFTQQEYLYILSQTDKNQALAFSSLDIQGSVREGNWSRFVIWLRCFFSGVRTTALGFSS